MVVNSILCFISNYIKTLSRPSSPENLVEETYTTQECNMMAAATTCDENDGPLYFNRYLPSLSPTFAIHPVATVNKDDGYWWGH